MSYGPGYSEGWTREGEPGYGPSSGSHPHWPEDGYGQPPGSPPANGYGGYPQQPNYGGYPQEPNHGGYPQQPPPYQPPYQPPTYPPPYQPAYPEPPYHPPTQAFPAPAQPDYGFDEPTRTNYYGPADAPRSIEAPRGGDFAFGNEPARGWRPEEYGYADPPPRDRPRPPGRRPGDDRGGPRPPKRRRSAWFSTLVAVGVVALLAIGLLGLRFILTKDEGSGDKAGAATASLRDLGTRDVDPQALTAQEVFPATSIPAKAGLPYQIIKTQITADCGVAATGDLVNLIKSHGCNQVARATLKTADNVYVITTGLFNLVDEAGANEVKNAIKPTVDKGKGRFVGYVAGPTTEAFVRAPTYIGFDVRGHFLAYCVIARTDGQPFSATDSQSALKDITVDLVETYMFDSVLAARASHPATDGSAVPTT